MGFLEYFMLWYSIGFISCCCLIYIDGRLAVRDLPFLIGCSVFGAAIPLGYIVYLYYDKVIWQRKDEER